MSTRPLDRPCHAVVTFYPEGARYALNAHRGSCDWQARYVRDGKPVCGVHLRAKTVEFYDPGEFIRETPSKELWPA